MNQKEKLIELLTKMDILGTPTEHFTECLADHLLANGVIALPCKFQQLCYVIPTIENKLTDITKMKCIGFCLSCDSYNANLIADKNKLYQPCFGDFGKTVFLTCKEAEKAIAERNEANG